MIVSFISTTVCPLARTIRQRRIALGMTQAELAQRMGKETTWRSIQRLEAGRICMPGWARLQRLALALKLPIGDLLQRSSRVRKIDS